MFVLHFVQRQLMSDFETEFQAQLAQAIVDEAVRPSLAAVGETVSLPFKALFVLCNPLRKWIAEKNYNYEEFIRVLEAKAGNISPHNLEAPEANVAIPALQAVAYSMDSEELRDMFANLIVSSMNVDTKQNVHPSFVEIIKQLSPDEVRLLAYIKKKKNVPFIYLKKKNLLDKEEDSLSIINKELKINFYFGSYCQTFNSKQSSYILIV